MARKKTKEEKDYNVLLANVRDLCKTGFGKEFIWNVLSFADLYSESFSKDNQIYYHEGRRSVGLHILRLLEDADPSIYPRLILEKQKYQGDVNGNDSDDTGTDSGYGTDSD